VQVPGSDFLQNTLSQLLEIRGLSIRYLPPGGSPVHPVKFVNLRVGAGEILGVMGEERAVINRHPEYSWSILRLFPGLEDASLYALHHHENFDGTGYPSKLKGTDIPVVSRIVSVIDAYDAMVSNRCYRKGLPHAEAVRRLVESSGTQFDRDVVQTFIPIAEQDAEAVFAAAGTSAQAAL
jgi:hypothetical protein